MYLYLSIWKIFRSPDILKIFSATDLTLNAIIGSLHELLDTKRAMI